MRHNNTLNFNCCYSQLSSKYKVGVGICLRSELELSMGVKIHWFQTIVDVKMGEAYEMLKVVEWMREPRFKDVIFEMDSKMVSRWITKFY